MIGFTLGTATYATIGLSSLPFFTKAIFATTFTPMAMDWFEKNEE